MAPVLAAAARDHQQPAFLSRTIAAISAGRCAPDVDGASAALAPSAHGVSCARRVA
jgi:hypothetical protein